MKIKKHGKLLRLKIVFHGCFINVYLSFKIMVRIFLLKCKIQLLFSK